jgi:magnesium chelatase subunit I
LSGIERSGEEKTKRDLISSHDGSVEVDLQPTVRSLRELLDRVTGRDFQQPQSSEDSGIAEILPFPFLALVGQYEMKLALMLTLINTAAGGVLLIGPRGTGKTTAVRSLIDLLPEVPRSLCYYGCMPEDIESGGIDAVCPDCARKYAEGEPLAKIDRGRLVELPLNARLEEVVGGVDERAALHSRLSIRRGLLAQADHNLLDDEVVDALLDAAAQGYYSVRRGAVSASYKSRFVLVGSMNPEEGRLRPQIQDRFGLRVVVRGLENTQERLEAYRRVQAYYSNPHQTVNNFVTETEIAKDEIQAARDNLPNVFLKDEIAQSGLELISRLKIDSLRAEITLFEGARAYAAAEGRQEVNLDDLRVIAPLALRLRRSNFMDGYIEQQQTEESELLEILNSVITTKTS